MTRVLCTSCEGSGVVECDCLDCYPPALLDCTVCDGSGLAPMTTIRDTKGRI